MATVNYRHDDQLAPSPTNMGRATRMFMDTAKDGRRCAILVIGKTGAEFSVHLDPSDAQWLRKAAIEAATHMGATDDDAR